MSNINQDMHKFPHSSLSEDADFELDRILAGVRRQYGFIIRVGLIGVVLGFFYTLVAVPEYTSTASVLIDKAASGALSATPQLAELMNDTSAIDSQVEIIKSQKVILDVIRNLDLYNDKEFNADKSSFFSLILAPIGTAIRPSSWFSKEISEEGRKLNWEQNAVTFLGAKIDIERVKRTYVLDLSVTTPFPSLSARLANAFAEAYIKDQLTSRYNVSQLASSWMLERIRDIKAQAQAADSVVQKFKADNNLISSDGKLVDEQQLQQLNQAFVDARNQTSRAQARYQRIQSIIESGDMDAAVSEALNNTVINELRAKYLKVSKSYRELLPQLGPDHVQIKNLQGEMAEYQKQIFDELKRISESYKSEFSIAEAGEKSIVESLKGVVGVNAVNNQVMVQLRSLQSEADSLKNLYNSFLERYQATVQQGTMPVSDARIITYAKANLAPTRPKKALSLALGFALGLLAGGVLALLREKLDKGFRTRSQVREILDLDVLGMLPKLKQDQKDAKNKGGRHKKSKSLIESFKSVLRLKVEDIQDEVKNLIFPREDRGDVSLDPKLILNFSISAPNSSYAEALRSAKVAIDANFQKKGAKIIGMVSTFPNEGKSTTSKNFASLLASLGLRTLLIDGDLKNYGLSRSFSPNCVRGIVEALVDPSRFRDSVTKEIESGLDVIPVHTKARIKNSSEILSSRAMRDLLARHALDYDYIIFDLPPLAPVVDVKAAVDMFDGFILLIEWGVSDRGSVSLTLEDNQRVYDKCIGVLMNKVDPKKIKLYEYYGSYYYRRYNRYYRQRYYHDEDRL